MRALLNLILRLFSLKVIIEEVDDLPDPGAVPEDQKWDVVDARVAAGLIPWPSLRPTDYLNQVNAICGCCGRKIYGGMAIGGPYEPGVDDSTERCGDCWPSTGLGQPEV